ncbi:carotenoid isomerase [Phaeodactylum tricornutum CCAP 1055/1]|uniref:Carotenoid isomerase n=2 Tax=Phaeodactylum tricornutum TaxID=2850 RepID=B7G5L7_PHATC|nr:carotenoid isomerase [Phaeodactylum tricornutum CCAP 1055/1]EEC46339.1 carotenoid isomerase [Phaeodactylum tricornutum CCAP 1055/1]|eukprot:XP_002182438.1 carotenoid isomerase [Phaeodactylum tricornutum CCAP 1055/1]
MLVESKKSRDGSRTSSRSLDTKTHCVCSTSKQNSVRPANTLLRSRARHTLIWLVFYVWEWNTTTTAFAPSPSRIAAFRASRGRKLTTSVSSLVSGDKRDCASPADDLVDVAIIGAGLGGLCAGAILNTLYGKKVGIYEAHYLAGGCAHAFDRRAADGVNFTFDSGPTILLGCSSPPFNALQQVLDAVGQKNPGKDNELRWKVILGRDEFQRGPLTRFGGPKALEEFEALREATKDLLAGAKIPAMAMRPGPSALVPLIRYFSTLVTLLSQGSKATGTFASFIDGPNFTVTDPWLRSWLDALAFSLSGLPASRTAAAAMAFTLSDMHRPGAALDYPKGGMGAIAEALVRGVQQGSNGSQVHLRQPVEKIDFSEDGTIATGLTLRNGRRILAREGVICNAPVWSLKSLRPTRSGEADETLLGACDTAEKTGSFLHLHLALESSGLNLDNLEAHYTVMDRSLGGDGSSVNGVLDGPCGILNMIAVSNPCKIDNSLAPDGTIVVHAYSAGNEPYEIWEGLDRRSDGYMCLKEDRAEVLWRAVESIIPDARNRVVISEIGSPITHERFLNRPRGTYGSATEDYLADGSTSIGNLLLAGDGIFPGIGLPAVAISGASAANAMVSVFKQWECLDELGKSQKL